MRRRDRQCGQGRVRALVQRYTPAGATAPPIISGEWGYSTCVAPCSYYPYTGEADEALQARPLARQWLLMAAEGGAAVWCTFLETGDDPTAMGDMLGVVRHAYGAQGAPHALLSMRGGALGGEGKSSSPALYDRGFSFFSR